MAGFIDGEISLYNAKRAFAKKFLEQLTLSTERFSVGFSVVNMNNNRVVRIKDVRDVGAVRQCNMTIIAGEHVKVVKGRTRKQLEKNEGICIIMQEVISEPSLRIKYITAGPSRNSRTHNMEMAEPDMASERINKNAYYTFLN